MSEILIRNGLIIKETGSIRTDIRIIDEKINEPHVLFNSITKIRSQQESIFRQCNEFENVAGAKAYANHMKTAIEAI